MGGSPPLARRARLLAYPGVPVQLRRAASAFRTIFANAWLGSGYNLGSASGAALGGQTLALTGPRLVAVALAAVAAVAAVVPTARRPLFSVSAPAAALPPWAAPGPAAARVYSSEALGSRSGRRGV